MNNSLQDQRSHHSGRYSQIDEKSLVERMKLILMELRADPSDMTDILELGEKLQEVPYWNEILQEVNYRHGSIEHFCRTKMPANLVSKTTIPFPSPEQDETTTQMLEHPRLLIRDRPGTGKTAPVIKAKYALEQLLEDGKKVNAVVVCPNYVLSSWQEKIRQYTTTNPKVITITSSTRETELQAVEDALNGKGNDFVLVSYDAIFRDTNGTTHDTIEETPQSKKEDNQNGESTLADRLVEVFSKSKNPLMVVIDECHNAKNPEAFRTKAVRKLATAADYFYALSGNPFPDSLDDISEIASLLDPINFPDAESFNRAYNKNPKLIRLFLKRFGKEPVLDISSIKGMPKVINHDPIEIMLNPEEEELYQTIQDYREFDTGTKMALLRLVATDGRALVHRSSGNKLEERLKTFYKDNPAAEGLAREIHSTKYAELDNLVREITDRGERVVIWTKLRDGITTELEKRYASYGSIRVDGTVNSDAKDKKYSDRDIARLTVQTNPDVKVVVASIDSLREGQDLQSINNVVFIQEDVSPGNNDQAIARVARRGQTKDVNVYRIRAKGTIDTGYARLENEKREGINEIDNGRVLTKEQRDALERKKPIADQVAVKGHTINSHSLILLWSGMMINKGSALNQKFLNIGDNALLYARAYNHDWLYSYSAHTSRFVASLLNERVAQLNDPSILEKILEICSGPAALARALKMPTTCVDINPFQLTFGKRECARLGIDITTLEGDAEKLDSLEDSSYTTAVLANGLHYGNLENGGRRNMLLEANRKIRIGNPFVLTLPFNIVQGDGRKLLEEGIVKLGFEPVKGRVGYARAVDSIDKDYRIYGGIFTKTSDNDLNAYADQTLNRFFVLNPAFFYTKGKSDTSNGNSSPYQEPNKEICSEFEFVESGVKISLTSPKEIKNAPAKQIVTDADEIVRLFNQYKPKIIDPRRRI